MKPNITIPADLYEQLYDEIMNHDFNPEDEDDNKCYIDEIEIGKFTLNVVAYFNLEYVDDSFSHAFGVEEGHHYEVGELEDLDIESVWYYDEDTDYEEDVTEKFDMKAFWEQFKVYDKIVRDHTYHSGDIVEVSHNRYSNYWRKVVFLHYDRRLHTYICREVNAKYATSRYSYIRPCE